MELRRFEALATGAERATKVVFDLAKPYDELQSARKTALAAAESVGEIAPRAAREGMHTASASSVAQAEYEMQAVAEAATALAETARRR